MLKNKKITAFLLATTVLGSGMFAFNSINVNAEEANASNKQEESKKRMMTYRFVSEDGSVLPDEVMRQLPKKEPLPHNDKLDLYDTFSSNIYKEDGFWTLDKITPQTIPAGTDDVEVTCTWKFIKVSKNGNPIVSYKFVSEDKTLNLPEAIMDTLPKDEEVKEKKVYLPNYLKSVEIVDDTLKGVWKFAGWDNDGTKEIIGSMTITGTWKFQKFNSNVSYFFRSGTPGVMFPEELTNRTPKTQEGFKIDEKVTPTEAFDKSDYYDKVSKGTWKFKGFDKAEDTMKETGVKFEGIWEFTKDAEKNKDNSAGKSDSKNEQTTTEQNDSPKKPDIGGKTDVKPEKNEQKAEDKKDANNSKQVKPEEIRVKEGKKTVIMFQNNTKNNEKQEIKSPKTFDRGIGAFSAYGIIAGIGAFILKRKRD